MRGGRAKRVEIPLLRRMRGGCSFDLHRKSALALLLLLSNFQFDMRHGGMLAATIVGIDSDRDHGHGIRWMDKRTKQPLD
jgi:hypothetical protein